MSRKIPRMGREEVAGGRERGLERKRKRERFMIAVWFRKVFKEEVLVNIELLCYWNNHIC